MAISRTQHPRSGSRRKATWYPVNTPAKYRLLSEMEKARQGGQIVNFSKDGLTLECSPALLPGLAVDLVIPWPASQGKGAGLKLHAVGRTIRSDGKRTVVRIDQSIFRFDG
jgi:hypothetical protein